MVGLLITILLAFFLKGCIKMLPVQERQPKRVLRLVAITIAALLGTVLIVLLVGFLVRGATGFLALIMGPMFSIVLSILSVLIPLIAGLLFLAAALLGWSARLAHLYEELCTLERKINELNGHVDYRIRELLPPPGPAMDIVKVPIIKTASTAVLLLLLVAGNIQLDAQTTARARIDITSSVDPIDMANGLRMLSESASAITTTYGVSRWEIIPFSENGWTAAPAAVIDMPDLHSVNCPSVERSEADFFRGVATARLDEAQRKCDQLKNVARRQYEAVLAIKLSEVRARAGTALPSTTSDTGQE